MNNLRRAVKLAGAATVLGLGGTVLLDAANVLDLTDKPAIRAVRTGITTVSIICDYKFSLYNKITDSPEYVTAKSQAHTRAANKLLALCWRNRGTYVKVGQHLGAMDYLLPAEFTKVLKVLHSDAPQSTLDEIHGVLKKDLNIKSVDEVFTDFCEKPLGTASLAQVYKAKLKSDGSTVAVKVQHPTVQDLADKDMAMMDYAALWVKKLFPEFDLMWLVEETRKNLPLELDFLVEARNCSKATENLKCFDWVKLPKVHWDYCTRRVMVMEFLEGGQVNNSNYLKRNNIDFNHVSRLLGKLFSEMIFVHGFVHCDPHPGNILVRWSDNETSDSIFKRCAKFLGFCSPKLEIVLLDHGLYRQLSKNFRFHYASLWQAIINTDMAGIETHARACGSGDMYPLLATIVTGRSWQVVGNDGIKNVDFTFEEDKDIRGNAGNFLPHISNVLGNVSSEMLLVLKTNDHLRGLEYTYGVRGHVSGFLDMSKSCLRALRELQHERLDTRLSATTKWLTSMQNNVNINLSLLKIFAYEWYLWVLEVTGYQKHIKKTSYNAKKKKKKAVTSAAFVLQAT
ncbi:aarF domain-containing protein kinase 1-like [Ciona intestinalis]